MLTAAAVPAELDRPFHDLDLDAVPTILVAVSGGSDSTALLLLLHAHLSQFRPQARLVAATVDHGLRAGSAAEAAVMASLCARLDIEHITLGWTGEKPATGLSHAAREARYGLLAGAADACGATVVVTGHTADDQAETVRMRARRGPGRGLAGMAPATLYDGRIWLLRPLLDLRRAALRDWLRSIGQTWIDDPSNHNDDYERVRVRAELADPTAFALAMQVQAQAAAMRRALAADAGALIDRHATLPSPGLVRIDPALAVAENGAASLFALRLLLAMTGGETFLPDAGRAADLLQLAAGAQGRATLARTILDRRGRGIFLHREARGLPLSSQPAPGDIWDGRVRIVGELPPGAHIAPLGPLQAARLTPEREDPPPALARAALLAHPALWTRDGAADLLGPFGRIEARPVVAPFARFLPSFDLPAASAAARLIGARESGAPPCRGHDRVSA